MRQLVEEGSQGNGGMELTMPAEPASVPVLRHRASEFAAAQGVGQPVVEDVALAVSEAVTNAVKYADAAEADGVVELTGALRDGWLEVTVRDRGEGFGKGSTDGLGLGLTIIARLCSELTIVQEGDGTEVRMRFALSE
ncbi:MAG TPA: ATP-binding protein [Solirubrobacterales bacterium]|nr:ATP-binding protein [Solirubrobacterales bacterium]